MSEIDEAQRKQLYDRQQYVVGAETQAKYAATDVLLVGLSGLGCEIAKNLVLTGVRTLRLLDRTALRIEDLSTFFLGDESDVGRPRADVATPKLAEMNRFVDVGLVTDDAVSEILISKFHVVIFVDHFTTKLIQENEWARRHHVKFVACENRGLSGSIFVDGGDAHHIVDSSGEDTVSCIVTEISKDGTIVCHADKKHECEVGSKVYFTGIKSPQSLNSPADSSTKTLFNVASVLGPFALKIDGASLDDGELQPGTGAYLHTTKKTAVVKYATLAESIENPNYNFIIDSDDKLCSASQLHAMYKWAHANIRDGVVDVDTAVANLTTEIEDAKLVRGIIGSFCGQLNPLACVIGGLASQEALKLTSGKFTPIDQWFYFDIREVIPLLGSAVDRSPLGSRFDGQIKAIGQELSKAINTSTAFIVGAGALGCEHIKNAALLGFKSVSITDMDTIEVSNLSRQFLFRNWHVGKMKSEVAALAASAINNSMKIESFNFKVGRDTEDVFSEPFWLKHTVVLNALDNIPARRYVDEQCVFYKRPLFESGTLGAKANSQVVIPHITESYGNSADPPEKSIPLCTLKHFPNAIEHTIQWARDQFHSLFVSSPSDVREYIANPSKFLDTLEHDQATKPLVMKAISESIEFWPTSVKDCVDISRRKFDELFDHAIQQLLATFPLDKVVDGKPFWSGAHKPPAPIVFSSSDELHFAFVRHTAFLLTKIFGIPCGDDFDAQVLIAASAFVSLPFIPRGDVVVDLTDGTESQREPRSQTSTAVMIPSHQHIQNLRVVPQEFEKDDDSNGHIDFITACSNLRASNYAIPLADRPRTKLIAGNIIPAMVTTTSLVTGLVMIEVLKYLGGLKEISQYRNSFVNIALPQFVFSDPVPTPARSYSRPDESIVRWTMWDRIDVEIENCTIKQLVDALTLEQQLDVFMIALPSGKMLYSSFGRKEMNRLVRDVAADRGAKIEGVKHIMTVVSGTFNDEEVNVPLVRVRL
jgi:ubiquitin-activating enzyme E1